MTFASPAMYSALVLAEPLIREVRELIRGLV